MNPIRLVFVLCTALAVAQEPHAFLTNQGQWPAHVRCGVRHGDQTTWLTDTGWTTQVAATDWQPGPGAKAGLDPGPEWQTAVLEVELLGGTRANDSLHDVLPGTVGFFLGNDPRQHAPAVPRHACVERKGAWPGVDLAWGTREGQVAYDLHFAAGVAVATARFVVRGAQRTWIDGRGALALDVGFGTLRHAAPVAWQVAEGGARQLLPARFVLDGDVVGFVVEGRDPQRELVVDPSLVWSTLLGGTGDDVSAVRQGVDRDAAGRIVTCGGTTSFSWPLTGFGARGLKDGYIAVRTPQGALAWEAFLAGSNGQDQIGAVRWDGVGGMFFGGNSSSSNFPTVNPTQPTNQGPIGGQWGDMVLGRLAPSGAGFSLTWSTYLGSTAEDATFAIQPLAGGRCAVAGWSLGAMTLPGPAPQPTPQGSYEGYVAILDPSLLLAQQVVQATWLGGNQIDIPNSIQCDLVGNLVVGGYTSSTTAFTTTPNALQSAFQGGAFDGFVSVYNANLTALLYATYLGGAGDDEADDIVFDSQNRLVIGSFVGGSTGFSFPLPLGGYDLTPNGGTYDGYAMVLDWTLPPAQQVVWGSYLGGSRYDGVNGITIDSADRITVVGPVQGDGPGSTTFPRTAWCMQQFVGGPSGPLGGQWDGFAARFDLRRQNNDQLVYCTFLGGTGFDYAYDVVLEDRAMAIVVGPTDSSPFLGTLGLGGTDHFVTQLDLIATVADRYPPANPFASPACSTLFLDAYHQQLPTGFDLELTCSNAPTSSIGVLAVGAPDLLGTPMPSLGITALLQVGSPFVTALWTSDSLGFASLRLQVPVPPPLLNLAAQAVWPGGCAPLLASDAIRL